MYYVLPKGSCFVASCRGGLLQGGRGKARRCEVTGCRLLQSVSRRRGGQYTMAASSSSRAATGGKTSSEEPKFTNALAQEKSPYLLQHMHNPVNWYPWGETAFEKAKNENKPIFLSIGYSTCHWCHVMERESFENEEIAEVINKSFVAIKLDREERPDIDAVYMTFVQATSGQGGWPMTVFMTPDLKPFVGATYLPPERFKFALTDLSAKWKQMEDKLVAEGDRILNALKQYVAQPRGGASYVASECLDRAISSAEEMYDTVEGGFGSRPKFPRPSVFDMLFTKVARDGGSEIGRSARNMALHTLRKMALGGMYDHLGGGFHRYSVDNFWHVPHFEKMLYDQSQLVLAYLQALQVDSDPLSEATVRGVLDYVSREMTNQSTGGFLSAEDADSEVPFSGSNEQAEKAEGAFYVWTQFELKLVLGEPAASLFFERFGVEVEGNAPLGSDPHNEFEGKNILKVFKSIEEVAEAHQMDPKEVERILSEAQRKLLAQRNTRPRPHVDDKILTSWNSMMVSAFAKAARVLDDDTYGGCALRAGEFLRDTMWDGSRLFRSYREGLSSIEGFAEDYAATVMAFLDLYELTGDSSWVKLAMRLQQAMDQEFWDSDGGGYFSARTGDESVVLRKMEDYDSAEPAPSSLAASGLVRLASITGRNEYLERCGDCAAAFSLVLDKSPFAMPLMVAASLAANDGQKRVVIAGSRESEDFKLMVRIFNKRLLPFVSLVQLDSHGSGEDASIFGEETAAMDARGGTATAYVCRGTTCMAPTNDLEMFEKQLKALTEPLQTAP
mmetsp:Transcript_9632/g.29197  ORF Transcript_9632/g.29197 Transcript_9632/m.29197 type:complete len:786 (+) Transcript_9632:110-2467(+)